MSSKQKEHHPNNTLVSDATELQLQKEHHPIDILASEAKELQLHSARPSPSVNTIEFAMTGQKDRYSDFNNNYKNLHINDGR